MQARLKVLHDKANVRQVRLLPVTLIGRSTDCNLKIASSQVSRNHCRITLGENAVYVEDLGSANGTLIDGRALPAHQPMSISPGSHLVVGPAEFLIDFVGPASPTMVLPGTQSGLSPELPSTEVIAPSAARSEGVVTADAHVPPYPSVSPPGTSVVARPVDADVVQPQLNPEQDAAVVAEEALPQSAFEPITAEAGSPTVEGHLVPKESDEVEFENPFETGAFVETTQFVFQETQPESAEFVTGVGEVQADASKKPGLKSLFSVFGRKDNTPQKGAKNASATAPMAAPSVFLPTMDQQVEPQPTEESQPAFTAPDAEQQLSFEPQEAEATTADASTDEDDGFSQFLQQL